MNFYIFNWLLPPLRCWCCCCFCTSFIIWFLYYFPSEFTSRPRLSTICETYWCNQAIILFKWCSFNITSSSLNCFTHPRFQVNTNIIIDNKILFLWFYFSKSTLFSREFVSLGVLENIIAFGNLKSDFE